MRTNVATKRALQTTLVLYWIALFISTHIALPDIEPPAISDKVFHASAFAGLTYLIMVTLLASGCGTHWPSRLAILALVAAYGAGDEISQGLVGRDASLADWYADLVGAVMGLLAFHLTESSWRRALA